MLPFITLVSNDTTASKLLRFSYQMSLNTGVVVSVGVLLLAVTSVYLFLPGEPSPIVTTQFGDVQGKTEVSRFGRKYFAYLGIPYGKPPVGELRYEPPEPWTEKWSGVRDAMKHGSKCIQINQVTLFHPFVDGNEDCLFLNIFTPMVNQKAKLPVLIFLHGGLFAFGHQDYTRGTRFMDKDMILVTVHYRLNSFGFLNTGDNGVVQGNQGLKDQVMAFKWVQENIAVFGGNPRQVTLSGESAGSASAHLHMLAKSSFGLFNKVVLMSGLATNPWAMYQGDPMEQAIRFGSRAGCPVHEGMEVMVKCLKGKDASDLVSLHHETVDRLSPLITRFLPTVEKHGFKTAFLSENPATLLAVGRWNKDVAIMAGINEEEGLILSPTIVANKSIRAQLYKDWRRNAQPLMFLPENVTQEQAETIKEHYRISFDEKEPEVKPYTDLISDWMFKIGFDKALRLHKDATSRAPIFLYFESHEVQYALAHYLKAQKGETHPLIEVAWMLVETWISTNLLGYPAPRYRGCHSDGVLLIFNAWELAPVGHGSWDDLFATELVNSIHDFMTIDARLEDGKASISFMGKEWEALKPNDSMVYMNLDYFNPEMIGNPLEEAVEFWKSLALF